MQQTVKKKETGFTLIEMALVIAIIGLLIGGVLKGHEIAKQAKVKSCISQVDGLRAAILTFYDRFGQFPGDENLPNVPGNESNAIPKGNANGKIENQEQFKLFRDLQLSSIISGSFDGTSQLPRNSYGGDISFVWSKPAGAIAAGHWFKIENVPWQAAFELDTKYDDGVWNTGSILSSSEYSSATDAVELFVAF